ncbi:MAG: Cache 3/Cache 2 fusion domain-containing protein [Pseudomonadota bacterium]|nr:Cache 3/Cache 2 fusion domain-containing protein [Pseudomonadota bacterium]
MGKNFKISLRVSVIGLFLSLFVATILTIVLFTSYRFYKSQLTISHQQMQNVSESVRHELRGTLRPAEEASALMVQLIKGGAVKPNDPQQMLEFTEQLLRSVTNSAMIYWADIQGNFIISRRETDNTISSEVINRAATPATDVKYFRDSLGNIIKTEPQQLKYDPRERPWYKDAMREKRFIWSDAYVFFSGAKKTLGITAASPVYSDTTLMGIVGIDMKLNSLSDFLSEQTIGKTGVSFIVNNRGNLIAYPNINKLQNNTEENTLSKINIIAPWQQAAFNDFIATGKTKFTYAYESNNYLATFSLIPSFASKNWYIAVVVPENDFVGELKHASMVTMQICIAILILGTLLITLFSRKISQSLNRLVKVTQEIREFKLDETPPIHSHIEEIAFLANAIYSMRSGLRAFQKYVPADLVRVLIHKGTGAQLGGSKKTITIFFSDIKNFTRTAEQMPPEQLMLHLCDYFDELTNIIRAQNGTIDKYIGDAIMAFWNSPQSDRDHCYHACLAAVNFQKKLGELNEKWQSEGKPTLPSRIGINTGEAIVGNLGSSTRINYTAIGDTINLASRLENINNVYGTNILVTEAAYKIVKDRFVFRIIDCIAVVGKHEHHFIYELIKEKTEELPEDEQNYIAQFEEAFHAYRQREWERAIALLTELNQQRPDDKAVTVFLERCAFLNHNPPSPEWDGVWRYTSKGE